MAFGKKPVVFKLCDLEEARSMYTQTNAFTGKNRTTTVHSGSVAFLASKLIIEELSIASAGTYKLKTVDIWTVLMTFFAILNRDHSYPYQNDLQNIPNKVTSNMEAAFKLDLQKQAYPFFNLQYFQYRLCFK